MIFNFEAPVNNLSFGNVCFGLSYEFFKRGISPNHFIIGQGADLSAFDKVEEDYKLYLQSCINKAFRNFKKNQPYFRLWHIFSGSWSKVSEPSYILTFHETDSLTDIEVNILNSYNKIFVTSSYSKKVFEDYGITSPVVHIKMGLDTLHYKPTNKKYFDDGRIVTSIFGKFEKRKKHKIAIQGWIKKFGGDKKYFLHLYIHNSFYKPEDMNKVYAEVFNNQPPPFNVQIFPFQPTNSLFNDCLNATDIVIDLSGGESISIPTLTALYLKKHVVAHYCTVMKDYLTEENSVLIYSNGKESCHDGVFFHSNQPFNQGNFYTFNEDDYLLALDEVVERYNKNPINEVGNKVKDDYNYSQAADKILNEISI